MIQRVIDQPWVFFGFMVAIVILNVCAALRTRRDRMRKRRSLSDRRKPERTGIDRRWRPR